jgi:hypothetical protein
MTPSKELFELIKSMNKAEKGYFKKYAQLHTAGKQNNYLILFDAISLQKIYDEPKLIRQLQKKNLSQHLAYWKNYLYARILDALENYHSKLNVNIRIRSSINRAEILQARGLYSHSARIVKKTKRLAEESESYPVLIDIYSSLEFMLNTEKYDYKNLENSYSNVERVYGSLRKNLLSRNIHIGMVRCYRLYSRTRNKKYLDEAKQLMDSPFLKDISNPSTFTGKIRYWGVNYFYWYLKNNLSRSYSYQKKIVDLFHENPGQVKNYPKTYMAVVNNLFVISTEQKNYATAQKHLQELRGSEVLAKTHSQKAGFYYQYNTNLLHYLCQTFNTGELSKNVPSVVLSLKSYEEEMSNYESIELFMHIAIAYYYLGNLKKCIVFLNKLRNEHDLSENPDIESFFYLFYAIVHYDAGNEEILSSSIQTFYRFLKTKENISVLELSIIRFLRKQSKLDTPEKLHEEFKKFKKILNSNKKNISDKYIFKYVDLSLWLESKIESKSFTELVKGG